MTARLPRAATPAGAVAALAAGAPEVILTVPGWLHTTDLRRPPARQAAGFAARTWAPVHVLWAWLREDGDGRTETAFTVWPCTVIHAPGFQCRDGRVFRASSRDARRLVWRNPGEVPAR
jgi:hypothetical protein